MMNMDRNKKHTLPRSIVLAACFLLLAGACDNYGYDGMEPDTPAREVPLDFNASIEKMKVAQSRSIISMESSGNAHKFGMSITKSENGSEIFSGSSDMTATMFRTSGSGPWNWKLLDNSNNQPVTTPVGPEGKALKVVAYYPIVNTATKDVYTRGIPFDFSAKTGLVQYDLLYNTETDYPFSSSGTPVATVPLNFRHAYTWIVINIKKYVEKGGDFKLSSVSLDNLGAGWIKNKGFIDPETGLAKEGSTAGPIGVTIDPPVALSTTQAQTYEFLVPSFMDTKVGNGDIVLVLNVNGINETFNLDKSYLNQSDDGKLFGFRQGYKNTYNLVYNNSALSMSIQDWSSEVINGDFGGDIPSSGVGYMKVNLSPAFWPAGLSTPDLLSAGDHMFADYLTTVAYGGNGDYVSVNAPLSPPEAMQIIDDINVYTKEKAYPVIQITKNDVSIAPIPWEDENGELVAKELCRKYNEDSFDDWRLPRATELRAVLIVVASDGSYSDLNFNIDANRDKPYWTGTEVDENQAWSISYKQGSYIKNSKLVLSPLDKKMTASVRCVRDAK